MRRCVRGWGRRACQGAQQLKNSLSAAANRLPILSLSGRRCWQAAVGLQQLSCRGRRGWRAAVGLVRRQGHRGWLDCGGSLRRLASVADADAQVGLGRRSVHPLRAAGRPLQAREPAAAASIRARPELKDVQGRLGSAAALWLGRLESPDLTRRDSERRLGATRSGRQTHILKGPLPPTHTPRSGSSCPASGGGGGGGVAGLGRHNAGRSTSGTGRRPGSSNPAQFARQERATAAAAGTKKLRRPGRLWRRSRPQAAPLAPLPKAPPLAPLWKTGGSGVGGPGAAAGGTGAAMRQGRAARRQGRAGSGPAEGDGAGGGGGLWSRLCVCVCVRARARARPRTCMREREGLRAVAGVASTA